MNGIAESAFKVQRFTWQPKPSKGKSSGGGGTYRTNRVVVNEEGFT